VRPEQAGIIFSMRVKRVRSKGGAGQWSIRPAAG
jgi:hypothetical protein